MYLLIIMPNSIYFLETITMICRVHLSSLKLREERLLLYYVMSLCKKLHMIFMSLGDGKISLFSYNVMFVFAYSVEPNGLWHCILKVDCIYHSDNF